MAYASGLIPNLVNGVSRQAPAVRLSTQVEEQINGYSTVTKGLRKRPPSLHGSTPSGWPVAAAYFHTIDRDPTERYKVAITNGAVKVVSLVDGTAKTVTYPDGTGYLGSSDPANDFEALTVADYTFILNKSHTILASTFAWPTQKPQCLVHVAAGVYSGDYKLYINGSIVAHYQTASTTPQEPDEATDHWDAAAGALSVIPENIARALIGGVELADGGMENLQWSDSPFLYDAEVSSAKVRVRLEDTLSASFAVTRYGNVIHIENTAGTAFTARVECTEPEAFRLHMGAESSFANLPTKGPDGFKIKVTGSESTSYDDYWVELDTSANTDIGVWRETYAPGGLAALNSAWLPHALIRQADGSFTVERIDYGTRDVGDVDSVPWPSFVGKKASAIVFHRNRFGICADEKVVLSRSDDIFSFFRASLLTTLDTDPIDVGINYEKVSKIQHAIEFNEQLLLVSAETQFRLAGDELLTPSTVNIRPISTLPASLKAAPVVAGSALYIPTSGLRSTAVREVFYDEQSGQNEESAVTDHVPGYLPANVTKLISAPKLELLMALTSDEPDRLYVYKYLWAGREKVQSSWSYWTFGGDILDADFVDDNLVLTLKRGSVCLIETVPCDEAFSDDGALTINLDRRYAASAGSLVAGNTTITLPYSAPTDLVVVTTEGVNVPIVSKVGVTVTLLGDHTGGTFYAGIPYTFDTELSEIVHRKVVGQVEVPVPFSELTVSTLQLLASDSSYLQIVVEEPYRDAHTTSIVGPLVGAWDDLLGEVGYSDGPTSVTIMAPAKEVTIRLVSASYLPCSVIGGAWEGVARRAR